MTLAAVVLAAGASSRMGRPKALLQWRGASFLHHVVMGAVAVGCEPIIVVDGAVSLQDDAAALPVKLITNVDWPRGQLSSLQFGLELIPDAFGVLVLTVDRPHVEVETLHRLANAHAADASAIWQPRYEGRSGHPIVYPAEIAALLRTLPPEDSPRTLLGQPEIAARRQTVDVDDAAVRDNLDRPGDLDRLPR